VNMKELMIQKNTCSRIAPRQHLDKVLKFESRLKAQSSTKSVQRCELIQSSISMRKIKLRLKVAELPGGSRAKTFEPLENFPILGEIQSLREGETTVVGSTARGISGPLNSMSNIKKEHVQER
jgi:hypothetical protein